MPADAQPYEALAIANDRRCRRAAVKRQAKAGELGFTELLALADKSHVVNATINDVLVWPRGSGQAIATRILAQTRVKANRRMGTLTVPEKKRVLAAAARVRPSSL